MAGIGFELQKLIRKGTLVSTIQAFMFGSVLSAGPMILTVLCIGIIGWISYGLFHQGILQVFSVTIVYTFAFSLILSGPFQLVFTRYVADKHFIKEFKDIYPGYFTSTVLVMVLALALAVPFYVLLEVWTPVGNILLYKIFGIAAFVFQCIIWQLMGFVGTTKEYQKVTWSYLFGTIVSILVSFLLIPSITVAGGMAGFCSGQLLIIVLLYRITTVELEKKQYWRKEYFVYLKKYYIIALIGLFFNIGIWIDKFLFWDHFEESNGTSFFFTYNYYDVPYFLSFFSIIPAMAYFLILTETNFYKAYSSFMKDILSQPLLIVKQRKNDMITTLKEGMRGMLKLQSITTLLLIVFAEQLLIFLGYRGVSIWLFRVLLLGAFFHVINMNINIIFLYYEMRKRALYLTILFAALNGIFTYISIQLGIQYFGYGFLLAGILTTAISWPLLVYSMKRIDFYIFANQPIESVINTDDKWRFRSSKVLVDEDSQETKIKNKQPEINS
ncbi:exopolysaccharide Pel transporter PelG [candidate division KSB1 bacterium]|nr:exopolysaccharide Pel transporter PelG [candidate division KSB1 bacterium]